MCRRLHMEAEAIHLAFDGGTVVVTGEPDEGAPRLAGRCRRSATNAERAEGRWYRAIVEQLHPPENRVQGRRRGPGLRRSGSWPASARRIPHQTEAVETWWKRRGRGVVVLPTGTGKTFVALLAIAKTARPALVVTPTIDLLNQWYGELVAAFGDPIGLIGGGHYDLQPITVSTYDSAYIHLERWGNRYGLLVFDKCRRFHGPTYAMSAIGSLAPFRLGLTATPNGPTAWRTPIPT